MADTNNRQGVRGVAGTTSDPHRGEKRALAARAACGVLVLGVFATILQSAVTAIPQWGYFKNPDGERFIVTLKLTATDICCEITVINSAVKDVTKKLHLISTR